MSENIITEFFNFSDLSNGARRTYHISFGLLMKFVGKTILEVTDSDIAAFRSSRSHLKRTTLNKDLRAFNSFYKWAMEKRLINQDPTQSIKAYSLKKSERIRENYITHEEALDLIKQPLKPKIIEHSWMRYRDQAILAVLYYGGFRTSEVSKLKWEQVDLENKSIFIAETKGHSSRSVMVPSSLIEILNVYKTKLIYQSSFVFFAKGREKLMSNGINRIVKKYVKAMGLRARGGFTKVTPLTLRHSYATYLTEKGVSTKILGEQMGNPTAVDRYAHSTERAKRSAAAHFE